MRLSLATALFFAASAHAVFFPAFNSTTITTSTTSTTTTASSTITTTTTTSSDAPTPTPTRYAMQCGGSMDGLCGDVCFCSAGQMNCHADPSARCYQMCRCVAETS